ASRLRDAGIAAIAGESTKSMKAQMRSANTSAARFAVIIGEDELLAGAVVLKQLSGEAEQETVALSDLPRIVSEKLRG
ncbi:MAG TPA: His/Gly/Thr/Pro-type tRNA ligase C-terminal domain-containing protein, partial [Tepidiformaceae bacterium]|nr:His/Gly/Thr/Pro-type tRNA ligase C-terminal domain-containing protein [Tepidiformaceae bacterium]